MANNICWHVLTSTYADVCWRQHACFSLLLSLRRIHSLLSGYLLAWYVEICRSRTSGLLKLRLPLRSGPSRKIAGWFASYICIEERMLTYADVCWRMLTYASAGLGIEAMAGLPSALRYNQHPEIIQARDHTVTAKGLIYMYVYSLAWFEHDLYLTTFYTFYTLSTMCVCVWEREREKESARAIERER